MVRTRSSEVKERARARVRASRRQGQSRLRAAGSRLRAAGQGPGRRSQAPQAGQGHVRPRRRCIEPGLESARHHRARTADREAAARGLGTAFDRIRISEPPQRCRIARPVAAIPGRASSRPDVPNTSIARSPGAGRSVSHGFGDLPKRTSPGSLRASSPPASMPDAITEILRRARAANGPHSPPIRRVPLHGHRMAQDGRFSRPGFFQTLAEGSRPEDDRGIRHAPGRGRARPGRRDSHEETPKERSPRTHEPSTATVRPDPGRPDRALWRGLAGPSPRHLFHRRDGGRRHADRDPRGRVAPDRLGLAGPERPRSRADRARPEARGGAGRPRSPGDHALAHRPLRRGGGARQEGPDRQVLGPRAPRPGRPGRRQGRLPRRAQGRCHGQGLSRGVARQAPGIEGRATRSP